MDGGVVCWGECSCGGGCNCSGGWVTGNSCDDACIGVTSECCCLEVGDAGCDCLPGDVVSNLVAPEVAAVAAADDDTAAPDELLEPDVDLMPTD